MSGPLLVAADARIAVDGVVRIEAFSLRVDAPRWALAGDVEPLVHLLASPGGARVGLARADSGEITLAGGTMALLGADVGRDDHLALVGMAPCDPPLPQDMTLLDCAVWSARLSGKGNASNGLAKNALDVVGLAQASSRFVASLALPERRALVLAQAIVHEPRVLVVETPLVDLDGEAAGFVFAALHAAARDRALLVSTRSITSPAEAEILRSVEGVSLFLGGQLVLHGTAGEVLAQGRLMGLTVRDDADPLVRRLEALGVRVAGGPRRFSLTLPQGVTPRDVLASAAAEGATVVELLPLV